MNDQNTLETSLRQTFLFAAMAQSALRQHSIARPASSKKPRRPAKTFEEFLTPPGWPTRISNLCVLLVTPAKLLNPTVQAISKITKETRYFEVVPCSLTTCEELKDGSVEKFLRWIVDFLPQSCRLLSSQSDVSPSLSLDIPAILDKAVERVATEKGVPQDVTAVWKASLLELVEETETPATPPKSFGPVLWVSLEGIRGVSRRLEISFPGMFNVIYGENATGKSSICQALWLATRTMPQPAGVGSMQAFLWSNLFSAETKVTLNVGGIVSTIPAPREAPAPHSDHQFLFQDDLFEMASRNLTMTILASLDSLTSRFVHE